MIKKRRRRTSKEDTTKQDAIDEVANNPEKLAEVEEKVKAPRKKKAEAKPKDTAEKPARKKRTETKPRKERKLTIKTYAVGLMKEGTYTDQQIVDMCKANEELPNANPDAGNIKWYRWDYNKKNPDDKLEQFVEDENGDVVKKIAGKKANKDESKPQLKEKPVKSTPVDPEEAAELAAEQPAKKRRRRKK